MSTQTSFDPARDSATHVVLDRVADLEETSALDLDPLYGSIDPDALDALIDDDRDVRIQFTYLDYRIDVDGRGTVRITPVQRSCADD